MARAEPSTTLRLGVSVFQIELDLSVLLCDHLTFGGLMKVGRQRLTDTLAESLFDEAAGVAAFAANEALGLHAGLACRGHGDLDGLIQAAPPIWTVSLIDPSANDCSVTVCPRLRASIRAFSTA